MQTYCIVCYQCVFADCYGYQPTEMEENLSEGLFSSVLQRTGYEGRQKVRDNFIPLFSLVQCGVLMPMGRKKEQTRLHPAAHCGSYVEVTVGFSGVLVLWERRQISVLNSHCLCVVSRWDLPPEQEHVPITFHTKFQHISYS